MGAGREMQRSNGNSRESEAQSFEEEKDEMLSVVGGVFIITKLWRISTAAALSWRQRQTCIRRRRRRSHRLLRSVPFPPLSQPAIASPPRPAGFACCVFGPPPRGASSPPGLRPP